MVNRRHSTHRRKPIHLRQQPDSPAARCSRAADHQPLLVPAAAPRNNSRLAQQPANFEREAQAATVLQHVLYLADYFFNDYFDGVRVGVTHFGNGGVVYGLDLEAGPLVFFA